MIRRLADSFRRADFGTLLLELIVVVVGILLALGVDTWWDSRAEEDLKREYLRSLHDSLQQDLAFMDDRILPEIELRIETSEHLKQVTPDTVPVTLEDQRDFVMDINRAGYFAVFRPQRSVIDDLVATGNLRLIDDAALRRSLLDYYERADNWAPYDEFARDLIWRKFRNEGTGFIPLEAVHMSKEGRAAAPVESMVAIVESEVFQRGLLNVGFMANWYKQRYENERDALVELIETVGQAVASAEG